MLLLLELDCEEVLFELVCDVGLLVLAFVLDSDDEIVVLELETLLLVLETRDEDFELVELDESLLEDSVEDVLTGFEVESDVDDKV